MSSKIAILPEISGATEPINEQQERKEKDFVVDTVQQMDIPLTQGVELPVDVDGISGLPEPADAIMKTEEVIENTVQASVNATLPRVKKVIKKQKVVEKLEGTQAAQGTPSPDLMRDFIDEQRKQNSYLRDMLADMKTFRAELSSLQAEKIFPESTKTKLVEDPVRPNDMIKQVSQATPAALPLPVELPPVPPFEQSTPVVQEQESYANRFKRAFNTAMNMNTNAVNTRARADPSSGMNVTTSQAFFF